MINSYWQVYKEFFKTCLAESASYRVNFFLIFIMDLIAYLSILLTVDFIFNNIENLGIWNRDQFIFFISFMLVIDHLHMTFISEGFWVLSDDIRLGQLDYILLKPHHSLFICFFRRIRPPSFANALVVWPFLIYQGMKINLDWWDWALIPFFVLISLLLLITFEFIISSLMFWIVQGYGVNFLRMQFQRLATWPDFVFQKNIRRIFTFLLPVLLVGSAPVRFIIDPNSWHYLLLMLFLQIILTFILFKVWKRALAQYESASS